MRKSFVDEYLDAAILGINQAKALKRNHTSVPLPDQRPGTMANWLDYVTEAMSAGDKAIANYLAKSDLAEMLQKEIAELPALKPMLAGRAPRSYWAIAGIKLDPKMQKLHIEAMLQSAVDAYRSVPADGRTLTLSQRGRRTDAEEALFTTLTWLGQDDCKAIAPETLGAVGELFQKDDALFQKVSEADAELAAFLVESAPPEVARDSGEPGAVLSI